MASQAYRKARNPSRGLVGSVQFRLLSQVDMQFLVTDETGSLSLRRLPNKDRRLADAVHLKNFDGISFSPLPYGVTPHSINLRTRIIIA